MKKWKRKWCDKKAVLVTECTMKILRGIDEYRQAMHDQSYGEIMRVDPIISSKEILFDLYDLRAISKRAYVEIITDRRLSETIQDIIYFARKPAE